MNIFSSVINEINEGKDPGLTSESSSGSDPSATVIW